MSRKYKGTDIRTDGAELIISQHTFSHKLVAEIHNLNSRQMSVLNAYHSIINLQTHYTKQQFISQLLDS